MSSQYRCMVLGTGPLARQRKLRSSFSLKLGTLSIVFDHALSDKRNGNTIFRVPRQRRARARISRKRSTHNHVHTQNGVREAAAAEEEGVVFLYYFSVGTRIKCRGCV